MAGLLGLPFPQQGADQGGTDVAGTQGDGLHHLVQQPPLGAQAFQLGRIAGKTIITFVLFYLVACFFAAVISELVINMGLYREFVVENLAADVTEAETSNILVTIVNAVPDNMISALGSNNKMLAVITCSVIIGVSIAAMGDKITVFKTFCDECSQIVQKFLDFLIIVCSPFSVFCMITPHLSPSTASIRSATSSLTSSSPSSS